MWYSDEIIQLIFIWMQGTTQKSALIMVHTLLIVKVYHEKFINPSVAHWASEDYQSLVCTCMERIRERPVKSKLFLMVSDVVGCIYIYIEYPGHELYPSFDHNGDMLFTWTQRYVIFFFFFYPRITEKIHRLLLITGSYLCTHLWSFFQHNL